MTAALWMPGATRLSSSHTGQPMLDGPPRAVWHRTVGQGFSGNATFLKKEGFEPHILWDPTTGEIGQFIPANLSGYALEHPSGTTQTNREGKYCVQIEVADHGKTWDITNPVNDHGQPTGMKGWPALRDWLGSLGIPEVWPGGAPPALGSRAEVTSGLWLTKAGHYSHSQVPNNHHTDPGHMDLAVLFAHTDPKVAPPARPDRLLGLQTPLMSGSDVAGVQHALVVAGNPGLQVTGVYDRQTADLIAVFQQHRGINERGVGPLTWAALRQVVHHQ